MNDEPISLAESLTGVVRSLRGPGSAAHGSATHGSVSSSTLGGVFGRWDEAVGPGVAAHAQPVKLDGARLVVEVDDPAWATQLKFLERELRARLAEVAGAHVEQFEIRVRRSQ